MAVYQFSALSDGQAISFNAAVDRLNFDQSNVAAGDLSLSQEGANLHVIVKSGTQAGKDIFLNNMLLEQVAATNFSFVDGSAARVGDNAVGATGDAAGNTINGTGGRDLLVGLGGNDSLNGGSGNDSLEGNAGNDTLTGSGGQDSFALREMGAANADLLSDFASNWDNIQLDAAVFTEIGAQGRFTASDARFFAGSAAHDADDRIIYNSATGQTFYDADGNGAGAAQLIATLPSGRGVVAGDFNVFGTPGSGGGNTINGTAGDDTLVGTSGDDTINGFGGNDSLDGGDGADRLNGGDGNDTLDAGSSRDPDDGNLETDADTLDGGMGDDLYLVHDGVVTLADPGGVDWVWAERVEWTLGDGFDNLRIVATADFDGVGGNGNDLANIIDPSGLEHGGTYHGFGGNDTLFGAQHGGQLFGDDGDDVLHGEMSTQMPTMFGGNGNDTLIMGGSMTGGAGSDSFVYLNDGEGGIVTDFASGVDKIHLDASGNMGALGTTGNFAPGDARFFSGAGATSGHDADDRVVYNTSTGDFYYDADGNGAGTAIRIGTLQGAPSFVATDIVVDNGNSGGGETINGTSGDDSLLGTAGDDTINGFAGNDTIDGAGGIDSMVGGDGNDLYFVDEEGDVIVEAENAGIDEVRSFAPSYALPDWVNNLTLIYGDGHYGEVGIGNAIDNVITGTDSFSFLRGMGGNDTLIGGGVVSGETFDTFVGGTGNDSMIGSDGTTDAFYLVGDTTTSYGQDTIIGGTERDDWGDRIFANTGEATSGIVVDLAAGTLTGGHAGSSVTLSGIESVWGTQFADRMTGNGSMNQLDGGAGDDTLNGGAGFDRLAGGSGADHFVFSNAPGGTPTDQVVDFQSGVDKIHLDANVMTALGASGNFAAGDARFFAGTAAHDADDRVIYDATTAHLFYDPDGTGSAAQQVIAEVGNVAATDIVVDNGSSGGGPGQTIFGGSGNDSIAGTSGNDFLNGGSGNDSLWGAAGNDTLTGSGGQDTFIFREYGGTNADRMTDFATNWDRIQVDDAAFTEAGAAGRLAAGDARFFAGAGASAGHDADDRFVFNTSTGQLYYDADGSGSGAAQLVATVQAGAGVAATDITVI